MIATVPCHKLLPSFQVKRDYVEGLGDCLDLVPIGAWHGNGRKAGWYRSMNFPCLLHPYGTYWLGTSSLRRISLFILIS